MDDASNDAMDHFEEVAALTDEIERLQATVNIWKAQHGEQSKEIERLRTALAGPHLREAVPVMGIRLHKEGEYTVVDAEIGGTWIEVIRERSDGKFCHTVEPSGMYSRYYSPMNTNT